MSQSQIEADYVIVGGGSAGCVLAGRLSEDPNMRVCLIEDGSHNDSFLVRWPAGFARLQGPRRRWEWETVPQRHMAGRAVPTAQGRMLGGGSAVNGMVYIRGNKRDYDAWAAEGNAGWSYADVLPYFRRSEDNSRLADAYHGTTGPLGVSDQRCPNPLSELFVRAGQEIGVPYSSDFNGARQEGVGLYQVTQRDGRRCSAAHAFLYPAMDRPNLRVLVNQRALRIIMKSGRATGIELGSRHGPRQTVIAQREVIISAGAINSPKLLLLSGIGPADELRQSGIEPVHDLPGVGKNLHDHVDAYVCLRINQPLSYTGHDRGLRAVRHGLQYMLFGTGAVTSNACEGGLFTSSTSDSDWPDIQLHFMPTALPTHQAVDGHSVTALCSALRPKSRGEVRLASADPWVEPSIDPNFLSHPDDIRANVAAVEVGRSVLSAPSFRKFSAGEAWPGADCRSKAELAEYVRRNAKTDYHPVGTCKMGNDALAVVDQSLRVHGVDGLRVIDNSIMPSIVSGNTNAPAIMIGERGADAILGRIVPRDAATSGAAASASARV